jgi:hypothetical protein
MPQNAKGGKKTRSVKKGTVSKSQIKYNRKTNYRKASKKRVPAGLVDCSICYEPTTKSDDNAVTCGKTKHAVCLACKKQIKDRVCPMCRSHKMHLPPVAPEPHFLAIYSKGSRFTSNDIGDADGKQIFIGEYPADENVTGSEAVGISRHHVGWG